jgi:hypothetical protein
MHPGRPIMYSHSVKREADGANLLRFERALRVELSG